MQAPPAAQFASRPVSVSGGKCHTVRDKRRWGNGGPGESRPDSRARAGDGDAFQEMTDPYRRELRVHC